MIINDLISLCLNNFTKRYKTVIQHTAFDLCIYYYFKYCAVYY